MLITFRTDNQGFNGFTIHREQNNVRHKLWQVWHVGVLIYLILVVSTNIILLLNLDSIFHMQLPQTSQGNGNCQSKTCQIGS